MKIRHLRIFKAVCEEGSITKAAEKLYISQPAVSSAINELETFLGVYLFDRISRKIYLNETGKLFLTKAVKVLDLYDDLEQNAKKIEDHAKIKIGSSITIANFILPGKIIEFEQLYENTPLEVTVENAWKIEEKLYRNEIDLGLIEGIIYNEELIKIPFSSYKLGVFCSPQHKLALDQKISIKQFLQEKLLLRETGSAIRDVFDSALLLHNLKATPTWTSINSQALIQAVKHNLGMTVLPKILVKRELESGSLCELKVNNLELINKNHIVFHKDKVQTKSFKTLIEIIQDKR